MASSDRGLIQSFSAGWASFWGLVAAIWVAAAIFLPVDAGAALRVAALAAGVGVVGAAMIR